MIFGKKKSKEYMSWCEYERKIGFLEGISFCMKARKTFLPQKK